MLICIPYNSGVYVPPPPAPMITNKPMTMLGAASLTRIVNTNIDDSFFQIDLPFSVTFLGKAYTRVFVGSNSYLTFGQGSSAYSSLGPANPPYPAIQISAADNSYQRVYCGAENGGSTYRIRFEGSASSGGTVGSPNMVWEIVFYRDILAQIDINVEANMRAPYGVSGVSNGTTYVLDMPNASYVGYRIALG